jgi:hypothetical protein
MKIQTLVMSGLIIGLSCGAVVAQDQPVQTPSQQSTTPANSKTPRITKRQINQQARIKQGVKSGELTKGETVRLEKEQAKIQRDKKAAKADGQITPQERQKLTREQNKASRDIYRLKHNKRESK